MKIYLLDGADMTDRERAYRTIAQTMRFPEWFGRNLDALADCLSELDRDSLVIIRGASALASSLDGYGEKLLDCFRDTAAQVGYKLVELS